MSDLRSKIIRLAHQNPEFRKDLLPLLAKDASEEKEAGYGQYGRGGSDPRWLNAKFPGVDDQGKPFARGERVLYWPSTKKFMTGKRAEQEWRDYLSNVGDEEGNPYARSASAVASRFMVKDK